MLNRTHHSLINTNQEGGKISKTYDSNGNGYSESEAGFLFEHIKEFYMKCGEFNIQTPSVYSFRIIEHALRYKIVEIAEFIPNDFSSEFTSNLKNNKLNEASNLLKLYLSIIKKAWDNDYTLGIDPNPLNFRLNEENKIYYVDVMPPRQKLINGYLLSFPEPPQEYKALIKSRYFSDFQIFSVFNFLLKETRICGIKGKCDFVIDNMGNILGNDIIDTFKLKTLNTLCNIQNNNISILDIDVIRSIATLYFERNYIKSENEIKEIFEQTFINASSMLNNKLGINRAIDILKPYVIKFQKNRLF